MLLKYFDYRGYSTLGQLFYEGFNSCGIKCHRIRYNTKTILDKEPPKTQHSLHLAPIFFLPQANNASFLNYHSNYISKEARQQYLGNSQILFTNSHQNLETLKESGYTRPLHRVLPCTHLSHFNKTMEIDKPLKDFFCFTTFATLDAVQGLDILLDAYINEFSHNDPVELLIRCNLTNPMEPSLNLKFWIDEIIRINNKTSPPRIKIIAEPIPDIRELYRITDVVVSCSRYECVGSSILEALASHCKVIAPLHSAFSEYAHEINSCGHILNYKELGGRYICDGSPGPFDLVKISNGGTWYECDIDHVRLQMRRAFENWKLSDNYRNNVDLSRFCHIKRSKQIYLLITGS